MGKYILVRSYNGRFFSKGMNELLMCVIVWMDFKVMM